MLFYLSQWLMEQAAGTGWESQLSFLRLFRYITFRGVAAAATALLITLWLGPSIIEWLKKIKFSQQYVDKAQEHGVGKEARSEKWGVPTMGGLMIVFTMDLTTMLWAQWNTLVMLTLLSAVVLCGLGFYDDFAKISQQSNKGAKANFKLWIQGILAIFIAIYLWRLPETHQLIDQVYLPFYKYPVLIGTAGSITGLIVTVLAIVGSSNAVNLTDGLDGLAIGCTVIVSFVFLIMTYVAGNAEFARYLQVPHVHGAGELTVFVASMIGAGLGFLWFNCYPAKVFMGDTGSLAIGGVLGIIAVLIHQPFVLIIAGGVFVMECGSVLIQTGWFKFTRMRTGTGQRVFLMAPLHHHFQKLGWRETEVVTRFYIICILFAVIALSTLKIR